MTLTPKESSLLKDMIGEEQLCVSKYQKYETTTYIEGVEVLKHDEKTHEAKAPTCTEIGWVIGL